MQLETITVKVTQENIDEAHGPDLGWDVLKRAFADAGYPDAHIGITSVWLNGWQGKRFAALPFEVIKFRRNVTLGFSVEPFFFDLDVKEVQGVRS